MSHFISVDWGTSNLRIRLVETPSLQIKEEILYPKGIKVVYADWEAQGGNQEQFFLDFLIQQIALFKKSIDPLMKILISGMASSGIGLRELPYAQLPFQTNGGTLYIENLMSPHFSNVFSLVSGVKSSTDVMRGEEVEIIGLMDEEDLKKTTIFILPGTHSKHVLCENGSVTDFNTFMTGECFDVIGNHTILSVSIEKGGLKSSENKAFEEGVKKAVNGLSLLNELFKIRANTLFGTKTKTENFYFLSGLLIGEELQTLRNRPVNTIKLCAGGKVSELYCKAIKVLGLLSKTQVVSKEEVDTAVVRGQWAILQNNKYIGD